MPQADSTDATVGTMMRLRGLTSSRATSAGRLRAWFNGPIAIERSAEMRYGEPSL